MEKREEEEEMLRDLMTALSKNNVAAVRVTKSDLGGKSLHFVCTTLSFRRQRARLISNFSEVSHTERTMVIETRDEEWLLRVHSPLWMYCTT